MSVLHVADIVSRQNAYDGIKSFLSRSLGNIHTADLQVSNSERFEIDNINTLIWSTIVIVLWKVKNLQTKLRQYATDVHRDLPRKPNPKKGKIGIT